MLKKLRKTAAISIAVVVATANCAAGPVRSPTDRVTFSQLKGVNVHGWLTWTSQTAPSSYRLPVFAEMRGALTGQELDLLKAAGFGFIRLTVDPGVFVLLEGKSRNDALVVLTTAVDSIQAAGLGVIVDMHPVSAVFPFGLAEGGGQSAFEKGPDHANARRYANAIAWLASHLNKKYSIHRLVAFELMNEPHAKCGDPLWTAQLTELYKATRTAAPQLTLVLNGSCSDGIDGLIALDPQVFKDENVLYTFHFYEDERFTSAGRVGGNNDHDLGISALGDLPYPWNARSREAVLSDVSQRVAPKGDAAKRFAIRQTSLYLEEKWNRQRIENRMKKVAEWATKHDIAASRILLGEFGANGRKNAVVGTRDEDRMRWISDVRQVAEAHRFRWAFWQYRGNGFTDAYELEGAKQGELQLDTLKALGLRSVPKQ